MPEKSISGVWTSRKRTLNPVSFSSRLDSAVTGVAKASPQERHRQAPEGGPRGEPAEPSATTMKIAEDEPDHGDDVGAAAQQDVDDAGRRREIAW